MPKRWFGFLFYKARVGTRRQNAQHAATESFPGHDARKTAVIRIHGGVSKQEISPATIHLPAIRQAAVAQIIDGLQFLRLGKRGAIYVNLVVFYRNLFARQTNHSFRNWISVTVVIKINFPSLRCAKPTSNLFEENPISV